MASENKELDSNVLFCPDTVLGVIERTVEKALSNARFSLDAETQNNRKLHYVKVFREKLNERVRPYPFVGTVPNIPALSQLIYEYKESNIEKIFDEVQLAVVRKRKSYPPKCTSYLKKRLKNEVRHLADFHFKIDHQPLEIKPLPASILGESLISDCGRQLKLLAKNIPSTICDAQNLKDVISGWNQGAYIAVADISMVENNN